jgi:DNA-binding response OmpR family regulator
MKIMKKVLVIDDDTAILDAVEMMLRDSGYEVETSTRAGRIIEENIPNLPDLIILDMWLQDEDGKEVCIKIRKNEKTSKIPVIMISSYSNAAKGIQVCGANDFLAKPFRMEDLLQKVRKNLNIANAKI